MERIVFRDMRSAVTDIRPMMVTDLVTLGSGLMQDHWAEIAREKDLMVLDPDWDRYRVLEEAGALLLLGAFVDDELAGYSIGLVVNHPHYRQMRCYQNDALFVAMAHRRSRLGIELIERTEAAAEERGSQWHAWHAKKGSTLDRLLDRRGYAVHDIIYARRARGLR